MKDTKSQVSLLHTWLHSLIPRSCTKTPRGFIIVKLHVAVQNDWSIYYGVGSLGRMDKYMYLATILSLPTSPHSKHTNIHTHIHSHMHTHIHIHTHTPHYVVSHPEELPFMERFEQRWNLIHKVWLITWSTACIVITGMDQFILSSSLGRWQMLGWEPLLLLLTTGM